MSQSSTRSEIQRLLAEIAALDERYENSLINNGVSGVEKGIINSIKKLREQLEKMQEKLLGVSIE